MLEVNQLYKGDCLEIMKDIADKSIDCIICDLPFGTTKNRWDVIIPFDKLWEQYERIIKDNGAILLFGSQPFTSKLILSNEKMFRYDMVWDREKGKDFLNSNRKPLKSHEDICVFYKKQPTYNKQYWYADPYTRTKGKSKKSGSQYNEHELVDTSSQDGRRNPLTVLRFPYSAGHGTLHPNQKPIDLLEWLIKTYTNEGEVVLDNCMGSASTIIAAINTSRQWIGIERDDTYFEVAKERVIKHLDGK